jgi:ribosomal protein L24
MAAPRIPTLFLGDMVEVKSGRHEGKRGTVIEVIPDLGKDQKPDPKIVIQQDGGHTLKVSAIETRLVKRGSVLPNVPSDEE